MTGCLRAIRHRRTVTRFGIILPSFILDCLPHRRRRMRALGFLLAELQER